MKYAQSTLGRVFILRLEEGDRLPETIETFAAEQGLLRGVCLLVGGADSGSRLIVGPVDGTVLPPEKMTITLPGVHEIAAVGTIFPDEEGRPSLHMHGACGRGEETRTGCVRSGVDIWKIGELVILELTGSAGRRRYDEETGFSLLSL